MIRVLVAGLAVAGAIRLFGAATPGAGPARTAPAYRGTLSFSTPGNGDPWGPAIVQDLDVASGAMTVRFNGLDATRGRTGEMAFVQRLANGYYADHGIVVADARDVPGAPVHVCKEFNWSSNRVCGSPRLSADGRFVAYAAASEGSVCKNNYGMYRGVFVFVTDRRGREVARFEGYTDPEWLPNGRLLLMGTQCRSAGIWIADRTLHDVSRIDEEQVATPAAAPAVSPDGRRVAFVWNNQLWGLSLAGRPELTQLTRLGKSVTAAAWSPDGTALAALLFDVSMPVRTVVLFRPGDESSVVARELPVYPYGPLSWR